MNKCSAGVRVFVQVAAAHSAVSCASCHLLHALYTCMLTLVACACCTVSERSVCPEQVSTQLHISHTTACCDSRQHSLFHHCIPPFAFNMDALAIDTLRRQLHSWHNVKAPDIRGKRMCGESSVATVMSRQWTHVHLTARSCYVADLHSKEAASTLFQAGAIQQAAAERNKRKLSAECVGKKWQTPCTLVFCTTVNKYKN